jgi:hypothetical protein
MFSLTSRSTCEFWVNPVNFTLLYELHSTNGEGAHYELRVGEVRLGLRGEAADIAAEHRRRPARQARRPQISASRSPGRNRSCGGLVAEELL